MLGLMSLLAASAAVVLALYAAAALLRSTRSMLVAPPYESGTLPVQHAVSRYHVRWYAVTVLFLAFDMEMVFMYPWAVVVSDVGISAVIEMFGFLLVLLVGVLYVWREGALRWA